MKVKGINLSEVIQSLELLKNLCNMHESCRTCWLYDPKEKETACLLVKAKEDSLAENIEIAQRFIEMSKNCIMPDCPYCPDCKYGTVIYPEDTMPGETGVDTEWICYFDPEVKENETAAMQDGLAAAGCADQDDRSGD